MAERLILSLFFITCSVLPYFIYLLVGRSMYIYIHCNIIFQHVCSVMESIVVQQQLK